ncbi:Nac domain-containing protein, partial [Thalictrum thalictroides]
MAAQFELPIGFRFQPSDVDICKYLANKKINSNFCSYPIFNADVYGAAPWDLPVIGAECNMGKGLGEHQYYFVVPKPRVCKAGNGRWIANTKHKPILDEQEDDIIGYKRTLTYYIFPKERQSSKDDIKTKWIMHEYRLQQTAK